MTTRDVSARFLDLYNGGDTPAALRTVLTDPGVEYDSVAQNPRDRAVLSYVDALAFGSPIDVQWTGTFLAESFSERSPALTFDLWLSKLRSNPQLLTTERHAGPNTGAPVLRALEAWVDALAGRVSWQNANLRASLDALPVPFRRLLALQIHFSAACDDFWRRHPELHEALGKPERSHAPLCRTPPPELLERLRHDCLRAAHGDEMPIVLMESYEGNWAPILEPLAHRPAWLVFRDAVSLSHGLSIGEIVDALDDPRHGLVVLDRYVPPQLVAQPQTAGWNARLQAIVSWDAPEYLARAPVALDALRQVLSEARDGQETPAANWLYRIGRDASLALRVRRLGASRLHDLRNQLVHASWNDPHKGELPATASIEPAAPDLLGLLLSRVSPIGPRRVPVRTRPLRLAHITAQVVDASHAPSRLLRTLFGHHDREAFELSLFVTEGFVRRPNEYPTSPWQTTPSTERAARTLAAFRDAGVKVVVADPADDQWMTVRSFARLLSEDEIDVAIFHGPDFIHHAIAALSDVPLRVLFEHGSLPDRSGFDIAIASAESEEGVERMKPRFAEMGTTLVRNAHVVDARTAWAPEPHPRSALGLPEDALIMTTISNHLEHRLSEPMCRAIVEILERCPRGFYAPMGPIGSDSRVARFFASSSVASRVRFLGSMPAPSQYARSMHLYLNEFPFGSGIALLDALAAGCPIVSMYDKNGPAQARYVGLYYGMDRVITSLDPKDYVECACRLLTDTPMYAEWRRAALERYAAHTDVDAYVKRFEDIVRNGLARIARG